MKSLVKVPLILLAVLLLSFLMASCSWDDDSPSAARSVSGTAATGSPLANAAVELVDANGRSWTTTTAADGSFTISASGLTPPVALKVTKDATTLYSVSPEVGRVNITPITTIIAAELMNGGDPAGILQQVGSLEESAFNTAKKQICDELELLFDVYGMAEFDPVSGTFAADHTGFDAVLDAITVSMDTTSGLLTIRTSDGATVLMEASLANGTVDATTSLDESKLAAIPELDGKLRGSYHVVDFNADIETDDTTSHVSWGSASLRPDGVIAIDFQGTNGGTTGPESLRYRISEAGKIDILNATGLEGVSGGTSHVANQAFIALSDTNREDGDTGLVFFLEKMDASSSVMIDGTYLMLEVTRNNTGVFETSDWNETIQFYWDSDGKVASYYEGSEVRGLFVQDDGRILDAEDELLGFSTRDGGILVMPETGDDPGFTLIYRSTASNNTAHLVSSNGPNTFQRVGFEVDEHNGSAGDAFMAESGTATFELGDDKQHVDLTVDGETLSLVLDNDGKYKLETSPGSQDPDYIGLHLESNFFIWIDLDDPDSTTDTFGWQLLFREWPTS